MKHDLSNTTKEEVAAILGWHLYDHEELPKWIDGAMTKGSPLIKIWTFLSNDKVERTSKGYTVWALEGYNVTPRHLTFDLMCDCQQYRKHQWCLHQYMVYIWQILMALRGHGFKIARKGPDILILVHTNPDPSADHDHAIVWNPKRNRWECSCLGYYWGEIKTPPEEWEGCSHVKEFFGLMRFYDDSTRMWDAINADPSQSWMRLDLSYVRNQIKERGGLV
jgi:hypothetical protein